QRQNAGELVRLFSHNYRGDRTLRSNMSIDVPDDDNCALFITGLPSMITTRVLLAHIRNTGRIWQAHINPPDGRWHAFAAAKVTFFARAAAEAFYRASQEDGFIVRGVRAKVQFNRHKVASQPVGSVYKTRVLIIKGNPALVNLGNLTNIMAGEIKFWDLDDHFVRPIGNPERGEGMVELTLQFGSFRAQAESANIVLNRRLGALGVTFCFGIDPCGAI
ncbi:hypothetical protein B0H67DRAFT_479764, partial [Lasiosphaeris hirsuta]